MNKKLLFEIIGSILALSLLVFLAVEGWDYYEGKANASPISSEVRVVNGVPKIFLNGKEFDVVAAQIYNFPNLTKYGPDWAAGVKKTIDTEKAAGANLILIHLWWSELDKSTTRPKNLGDNLNFTYVDQVMDYAQIKGMKVMLITGMQTFIPEWWQKEQGYFEPFKTSASICMPKEIGADKTCIPKELCTTSDIKAEYCCNKGAKELICCNVARSAANPDQHTGPKAIAVTRNYKILRCSNKDQGPLYNTCSSCETDNYGWKYNNPSMGYDKALTDYSEYLTAVINRYKDHSSLLGWQMQIGYSGEALYGPNYIAIQGLIGSMYGTETVKMGRMVDYSKVFQDAFKTWLTEKYKTTAALQSAWGDKNISLENFKIPLKSEFFANPTKDFPFPDNGYLNYFVKLNDLSPKGKDFYEFRKYMKKDSKYYSNLFKSLDPNHVLFVNSFDTFEEYENTNINGYFGNSRLNADRKESYEQLLPYAILASKYGQLALPAYENVYENTEDQAQLDTMEAAGKAMKCFGYGFGYVTALPGTGLPGTEIPIWSSANAKQVIRNIINYTPTKDCKCEFINKSYTWHGKTIKQILAMYNITDYNYCENSSNTGGSTSKTPSSEHRCGDGWCDGPETASICPQDCK